MKFAPLATTLLMLATTSYGEEISGSGLKTKGGLLVQEQPLNLALSPCNCEFRLVGQLRPPAKPSGTNGRQRIRLSIGGGAPKAVSLAIQDPAWNTVETRGKVFWLNIIIPLGI